MILKVAHFQQNQHKKIEQVPKTAQVNLAFSSAYQLRVMVKACIKRRLDASAM